MLGPEQLGCPRRFGSGKVSGPGRFESEKVRGGLSSEEVLGGLRGSRVRGAAAAQAEPQCPPRMLVCRTWPLLSCTRLCGAPASANGSLLVMRSAVRGALMGSRARLSGGVTRRGDGSSAMGRASPV